MLLNLYNLNDSDNTINKTLSNGYPIDIMLKSDTDISRPSITLQTIPEIDYRDFNYCEIPLLGRYFFIERVVNVNALVWRLECECDVLETYKSDILASNARFKRKIKNGDYYDASVDLSVVKTVSIHDSNKSLNKDGSSLILTTVGV